MALWEELKPVVAGVVSSLESSADTVAVIAQDFLRSKLADSRAPDPVPTIVADSPCLCDYLTGPSHVHFIGARADR